MLTFFKFLNTLIHLLVTLYLLYIGIGIVLVSPRVYVGDVLSSQSILIYSLTLQLIYFQKPLVEDFVSKNNFANFYLSFFTWNLYTRCSITYLSIHPKEYLYIFREDSLGQLVFFTPSPREIVGKGFSLYGDGVSCQAFVI